MHRGPAPKQAIGVTMASKNFSLFLMETFLLRKLTCWPRRLDSQIVNDNQYPELHVWNRLQTTCNLTICDRFPFFTLVMAPVEVVKNGGGWVCVVINTVFPHQFRPAPPKNPTSLSNNVMLSLDDLANMKNHLQISNPKVVASHPEDQIQMNIFQPCSPFRHCPMKY